ncbi:OmpA family protein [Myxococcus sp. SDU36]|uniref:OmpA family protein n=1 Tax=Myxococcus sp. SDU36 TaxID=2831967 RepID=UPI0025428427|nr:OmpA family protein [Myxococcus sp. SDU36]WIG93798.1 OmpA family protein [Myxococcus sp. SDU36]
MPLHIPAVPHARELRALARVVVPSLCFSPLLASAADLSFKLEPGVSIPLTAPQSEVYGVGGGQSLKALIGLTDWLDVGPSAQFMMLPNRTDAARSGVVWGFGGGLRLHRPHDEERFAGLSPWLDANALYVRTGHMNRPGFDVAAGVSLPIGEARNFWVGPFVRYLQVIQPERGTADNRDAKLLTLGVSFEFGTGRERAREPGEVRTVDVVSCPDRDGDTVPDNIDRCPDRAGPLDNWGCPQYEKVVIQRDKLELKEKLYFAWDDAQLLDASFPLLDEVAQALKDNPGFKVQVEGHTDSSGADDHNQALSERRAQAVLNYLVSRGVTQDRLVSKGFSSSVPADSNKTSAGRENNRRVEFVVNFIILDKESSK